MSGDETLPGPRTLAAIESHIARVEAERDAREPTQAEGDAHDGGAPDHAVGECFVPGGWTGRRCRHCGKWTWGGPTACVPCAERAECERLRAALREACDEAARWGHIAVGADADLLELHDALVATLARLRAVADGGAR